MVERGRAADNATDDDEGEYNAEADIPPGAVSGRFNSRLVLGYSVVVEPLRAARAERLTFAPAGAAFGA